jgi:hypothetical protein
MRGYTAGLIRGTMGDMEKVLLARRPFDHQGKQYGSIVVQEGDDLVAYAGVNTTPLARLAIRSNDIVALMRVGWAPGMMDLVEAEVRRAA